MMTDLFESDGWDVRFLGGGLTNDDILAFINDYGADILLIYGTAPKQAPSVRRLIDTIKSVNAWPDMRILVSGGLFNRAEGLWQEMEADLYAENAIEALQVASSDAPASHGEQRTINRRKKRRQVVPEPEQVAISA
jgi:methanogenic corrinoid protein MtbC1